MVVLHAILRQQRVLVTCKNTSFVLSCSRSFFFSDINFLTVFAANLINDFRGQILTELVFTIRLFKMEPTVCLVLWAALTLN